MSFSIKGKYAEAMVYTDLVESEAMKQVHNMLNQPITENTKVAMMPDIHAGKGATIGTTIKFHGENVEDVILFAITSHDIRAGLYPT